MAETLGSLCDKLTVLILKKWHTDETDKLENIKMQIGMIKQEIDEFVINAVNFANTPKNLYMPSNKVYEKKGNDINDIKGSIGQMISHLAFVNCKLWHQQEKTYEFFKVPYDKKDYVVKQLAVLNLERNKCIDQIDFEFSLLVKNIREKLIKGDMICT